MAVEVEKMLREDLALTHQLLRMWNMDFLVWNHASVRVPGTELFLVTPGDATFDGVDEGNIVMGSVNVTANVIHDAVYKARPDVSAVIHTHTPAIVAVGALRKALRSLSDEAALFDGSVGYYDWAGVSDNYEESKYIQAACAEPTMHTLIMRNHGVCTFGTNIRDAFLRAYTVERACRAQLDALKTRMTLRIPRMDVISKATVASPMASMPDTAWAALKSYVARQEAGWKPALAEYDTNEPEETQQARRDLSLAHQLTHLYGMDHLTFTSISSRVPGDQSRFLMSPGDRMFDDVQPQNLVLGEDSAHPTKSMHEVIYQAREDVKAIQFTKTPAVLALSMLEEGMNEYLEQDVAIFYERIAYADWTGDMETDLEEVRRRCDEGCSAIVLRNRGAILLGRSIREAWVLTFYLERTSRNFIEAKSVGEELVLPAPSLVKETRDMEEVSFRPGVWEWEPLRAMAERCGLRQRRRLTDVYL